MGTRGSRTSRALIVIGCIWLVVGVLGVAAHIGPRLYLAQAPQPEDGSIDIARIVLEPFIDIVIPILFIALVLGAAIQTVKLLYALLRPKA